MTGMIQHIKGITSDSRDVKPGYLFAALKGTRFDGRDYIDEAVKNGATHILAPIGTKVPDHVTMIETNDVRREFALMTAEFYGEQPDNIIAVTGTNGKTSVVEFIRQIWEINGVKSASLGTLGLTSEHAEGHNIMTTPDPVKLHALLVDLKAAGVNHLAMESSSHGLHQYRLDGVKPRVAAFTNLSQDHLDYHETMGDYFAAKARLFTDILPRDGYAVVNIDDEYGRRLPRHELTFGTHPDAVMKLLSQTPTSTGQTIEVDYQSKQYSISLNLIGSFQAYNVLCAAGCCIMNGMDVEAVMVSLPKLHGVKGRVELAANIDDRAAYIDYAHTPDALEKILMALRPHVKGRLVCVFGAGGDRDKGKRPQMGRIAAEYADHVIITDDNPRTENPDKIRDDILSACPKAENIGDRRAAIARSVEILNAGDVLLVAGKGHEQGQIIGDTSHPFDDLTETRKAMEAKFK